MGMFDWVKCEAPLPDGFHKDPKFKNNFQTKDFFRQMNTYTITIDGRLTSNLFQKEIDVPLTGTFRFYTSTVNEIEYTIHEYEATYKDDKLIGIEALPKDRVVKIGHRNVDTKKNVGP